MPKQFLLETVSVQPGDVTDATIATIRPTPKVISVGLLPKSTKNSPAANRVALLSVYDDATDAEMAAITAAVTATGLAIFVPNKDEAAKKKAAAAAAQESKDKKKGVTKKVSLAETAFTAKAEAPVKKAPVTSSRGGRGGAAAATAGADNNARTNSSGARGGSRGRGGSNNNNRNQSSGSRGGGRGRSSSARGGRGGRGGGRGGRGGRGGGRGGNNMGYMISRLPTHVQALMKLTPPSELMYRGAAPVGGRMNNMMMSQQFAAQQQQQQQPQGPLPGQTFSSSNLPPNAFAHYPNNQHYNTNNSAPAPLMMLTGPPPRLWSADVHAVFIANVAPPVTNKQLSLSSGEEIVVVHIERGEDVAIMYVATEQQARAAVLKLNGAFLHDRTLNVSYGGRKVIPLPYPPSHEAQQAQQQAKSNNDKKQIKNNNNNGGAAAAVAKQHVDPAVKVE